MRYISCRVSPSPLVSIWRTVVTSSEGRSARPVYSRKLRSHGARWPAIWRIPPCQTTLHYARCRSRGILMKCRLTRGRTALYLSHLREPCTLYTVYIDLNIFLGANTPTTVHGLLEYGRHTLDNIRIFRA